MVSFHAAADILTPPPERPPGGGRPGAISASAERVGPICGG